jgi:hypothetical protein
MGVRRIVASAVAAAMLGLLAVVFPANPVAAQGAPCEVGRPLVNVTYRFVDDQDLTSEGEVWALGTGISTFKLYDTGGGTFCATTTLVGTFTTFAGPSPAGTGTVPSGHTGRFVVQSVLRFEGTFEPILPTRGFVGTFDANCDQFECETPIQFGRKYLDVGGPPVAESFRAVYVSSCGVWIQTEDGNTGDIAC